MVSVEVGVILFLEAFPVFDSPRLRLTFLATRVSGVPTLDEDCLRRGRESKGWLLYPLVLGKIIIETGRFLRQRRGVRVTCVFPDCSCPVGFTSAPSGSVFPSPRPPNRTTTGSESLWVSRRHGGAHTAPSLFETSPSFDLPFRLEVSRNRGSRLWGLSFPFLLREGGGEGGGF